MSLRSRPDTNGREERDGAGTDALRLARPYLHQHTAEIQPYGTTVRYPIALDEKTRAESISMLNQLLADTMTLRDLYKKHHWQVSGATFHQLHLLFDKHHQEQLALVDAIAERVQMLGGISIAMAADVAETTMLMRPPRDREEPLLQLVRLIDAHERVLYGVRVAARRAASIGDDGTHDLLVSDVIRTNEKQAWLVQEHLERSRLSCGR